MTTAVNLVAIKSRKFLGQLTYRRSPVSKVQRRLVGRYALVPEIDLRDFTCRSVIDWISLRLWLGRETQHQWLQRDFEDAFGSKSFIEALNKRPGGVSDLFEFRVQEPDLVKIRSLCRKLYIKYDLQAPPIVSQIEVSVDFTPRKPSDFARAKLFTVLTHHFQPSRDVMSNRRDRPRFTFGTGAKNTVGVIGRPRTASSDNDHFLISTATDRQPFVDATYYVGAEDADIRWRIMDKVVDRQNKGAGTILVLDDTKKRVRVEVTLDRPEIAALGVDVLDDLKGLRFSRLQAKAFAFVLPTFLDPNRVGPSVRTAVQVWKDRQRMEKFLNAGAIGLQAMDGALERRMKALRRKSQCDLAKKGLKLKVPARTGVGSSGTFVSYEAMNERVGVALRHLGERVAAAFSTPEKDL
ncbi:hypothetical protein [Kaistia terrae]|uniref:Uncharacterized protein n=1 Tax=Kaistia terrae TaxID=537017 RepID=A0ABW0PZK8_9HYPH|nr:hypothetical protein [Kaistia terrae]MCX5578984.1 hypothetical protein [Kaistia terrae]